MAYAGLIKFILETNQRAIVEETPSGDASFNKHALINADFSSKVRGDSVTYTYDDPSALNNGRDVTLS